MMWRFLSICAGGLLAGLLKIGKRAGKEMKGYILEHDKDGIPNMKGIYNRNECPRWARSIYDGVWGPPKKGK